MEKISTENVAEKPVSPAEKVRSYLENEQKKLTEELAEKQKDLPEGERATISPDFRIIPPPAKIYRWT